MGQKTKRSKAVQSQSGRSGDKAKPDDMNQATAEEFEREGMGIAPKE